MRLPPSLLALLTAGAIAPNALTGCAADSQGSDDSAEQGEQEPAIDQEALRRKSQKDAGGAAVASSEDDAGEALESDEDSGATQAPSQPPFDNCPGCGLG